MGGGVVAAYLTQQDDPAPITIGSGARAGLLAGIVGAFVWLFAAMALNVIVAPLQERMVDAMIRNAQDMPPDVRVWLETIGNRASSPLRYVLGFLFHFFGGLMFSTFGGAIGGVFFRKETSIPGDIVPPPLPPE